MLEFYSMTLTCFRITPEYKQKRLSNLILSLT
nr:MAG TPA: hypothetical protein [Caudoviricetes sp.]